MRCRATFLLQLQLSMPTHSPDQQTLSYVTHTHILNSITCCTKQVKIPRQPPSSKRYSLAASTLIQGRSCTRLQPCQEMIDCTPSSRHSTQRCVCPVDSFSTSPHKHCSLAFTLLPKSNSDRCKDAPFPHSQTGRVSPRE